MPSSDARIRANQANAARSTGPKTVEGKEKSRQNALKHGMTGAGVVLPVEDVAAVERRYASFCAELQPSGDLGYTLLKRAATLAVRMEKCSHREMMNAAERVGRAMAECEVPDDADEAEATRLRAEAGRLAAFDTSSEARLARSYEAAAERGFFRALREFRLAENQAKSDEAERKAASMSEVLASFSQMKEHDDHFDARYAEIGLPALPDRFDPVAEAQIARRARVVDVPITVGRSR